MRRTFSLGGRKWKIARPARITHNGKKCDGLCDYDSRTISIRKNLTGVDLLETLVHELRHSTDERLDEDYVDTESREIAAVLWAWGFRQLDRQQLKTLGLD